MSDAAAVSVGLPAIGPLCDALLDASDRFASMLRQVRDPTVPAIGVWNIGETAAHASSSHAHFLAIARGDPVEVEDYDDIAESNARALAADPERDPQVLADRLARGEREFVSYVRGVEGDPLVEPFVGMKVPQSTVAAIELGEILVHGSISPGRPGCRGGSSRIRPL